MKKIEKSALKPYLGLFALTTGIIGLLALLIVSSIPRIKEGSHTQKPASSPQSRLPASQTNLAASIDPSVILLDCGIELSSQSKPAVLKSSKLRIKGLRCGNLLSQPKPQITIRNNSNGYEASILLLSATEFTTDYLSLVAGKNEISIEMLSNEGASQISRFTVSSSQDHQDTTSW